MSMLGPVTCNALTVIAPVFPLGELVCSLTMTLIPPGAESGSAMRERCGFDPSTSEGKGQSSHS